MSVRVMTWVWDSSPVGGTERLVLLAIADCADDAGANAWPSIATLARKTRVDERTVQRVIRRLVEGGHLLVEACAGGRGSNRYTVVMGAREVRPHEAAMEKPEQLSTPPADCHPRQIATGGAEPPQPRHSATAGVAQLRHPNVLEPSMNHPRARARPMASRRREAFGRTPAHERASPRRRERSPGDPSPRGAALPPAATEGRCARHPGQPSTNCGPCRSEALGGIA